MTATVGLALETVTVAIPERVVMLVPLIVVVTSSTKSVAINAVTVLVSLYVLEVAPVIETKTPPLFLYHW